MTDDTTSNLADTGASSLTSAASRIRVERIETTPMTDEQYHRAVQALAALINEWQSDNNAVNSNNAA